MPSQQLECASKETKNLIAFTGFYLDNRRFIHSANRRTNLCTVAYKLDHDGKCGLESDKVVHLCSF